MAAAAAGDPQHTGMFQGSGKSASLTGGLSSASFVDYPKHKPFINSDLLHTPGRPVVPYPESNSRAILSALKNLQEKIRRLELERMQAEENVKHLSRETADYKKVLTEQMQQREQSKTEVSKQNQVLERHLAHCESCRKQMTTTTEFTFPLSPISSELASQLATAESRCRLLEKQLEYMRQMIEHAEKEKTSLLDKQATLERERLDQSHVQSKLEKLDMLEQEYTKLTAMQSLAEKKMKELEQKLQEEEHARKLVQDKAAELQMGLETSKILFQAGSPSISAKSRKTKKKTKHPDKKCSPSGHLNTQPHYRLCLGDVPFVAGKSTGPSHSVGANVQHVLHLMKQHSKALCNNRVVTDVPLAKSIGSVPRTSKDRKPSLSNDSSSSQEELSEVLLTLQDEFGQMSFDHQQLTKLIQEAPTIALREDLERELEALVGRMEAKADQISKVRRHRARLDKLKREYKSKKSCGEERDRRFTKGTSEVRVTTTVTTRGKDAGPIKVKPGEKSRKNLQLLRDMQSIQTSLQKDDISWGY
ncbi:PREDICTED: centrosomal protein of 57 kDa isoform X1 [Gavialis gangeticus]|uniref:centrosomal protein of 57 kDa isoform X1 n=1 Tax=Gavialis gangeticus TaxID=94835 RepID=UPI00092F1CD7|nr:PREDICTED: centrosomal protein of 57 kDa isoform X1 [Gavialis gangeticus]